jgi:O-acetylserine/cysteine efflux transporter
MQLVLSVGAVETSPRMKPTHAALAVIVAIVWGVNFVIIHVGLETFPPLLFASIRFVFVAFPAIFFVGRPGVSWKAVVGIGLFMSAGQFGLLFTAIHIGLPAGLASLVLQVQAPFTILFAVAFLGERPARAQLVGVAVAIAGIAIIASGRSEGVPLLGLALCIAAGASWGTGIVFARKARPQRPVPLLVWTALVPPLPLAALSLAFEGSGEWSDAVSGLGTSGILALLYIVVLSTFFGYGAWNMLLGRYDASLVAPFTLLVPPVGIVAAWAALGESPNAAEIVGAVIVLGGVALTTGAFRRFRRAGRRSLRSAVSA